MQDPHYNSCQVEIERVFEYVQKATEDMTNGYFKWEDDEKVFWKNSLLAVLKCYNKLNEKLMVDLIDLRYFRNLIQPFHVRILLESTEEIFENPERMKFLEHISQVFETFMRVHLIQDVNYLPRIDSRHIQLMDPMMRCKIRDINCSNQEFKAKYLCAEFNIKKFCVRFLEKLFEINKARALGSGLRRLRLNILKMIKIVFELGLWNIEELPSFLELIHAKLQLLFCEENEFSDNFKCDPEESAEAYDPYYHENIACIINQATMLHTDKAFMNCFISKTNKGKHIPIEERITNSINRVYFNKKDSFNRMCFLLYDGILHSLGNLVNPDGTSNQQECYASRSTFMNLFDINNDLFLLSTSQIGEEKFKCYDELDAADSLDSSKDSSKVDKCFQELCNVVKNMRDGSVILDSSIALESQEQDPDNKNKSLHKTASLHQGETTESSLGTIKYIFDEIHNLVWLMKKSRSKTGFLMLAKKNLVTMILKVMDYTDRNAWKWADDEEEFEDQDAEKIDDVEGGDDQDKAEDDEEMDSGDSKREMLKKKLKKVVQKNIKSLKKCLKLRMQSNCYPESNEVVIVGYALLNDICSSSFDNKGLIFTEDGWYHFERIYKKHPLKSLQFLQDVFDLDKSLFYVDLTVFERIFNLYQKFCKKIFDNKTSRQIETSNGILMFAWNTLLAEILKINTQEVALPKVIHLFFKVQQIFNDDLIEFMFKFIINPEGLLMADDFAGLQFQFKIIGNSRRELLSMYNANEYYRDPEQGILLMELAYSFLRLFNKATKHCYPGNLLKSARLHFEQIHDDNPAVQYELIAKFKEGLHIRSEIVRCYRNFYIFNLNHLITPNQFENKFDIEAEDSWRLVPQSHVNSEGVYNFILKEIKGTLELSQTCPYWSEEEAQSFIENYFIKNLLLTIYKYVMGIYKLYHFNPDTIQEVCKCVYSLCVYLETNTKKAIAKLYDQFPSVKNIEFIYDFLEGLNIKIENFKKTKNIYKIEGEPLEEEEFSRPRYYKLKRYCVIILSSIEYLYEDMGFSRLLVKYRRIGYGNNDNDYDSYDRDNNITSHEVEAKFSINLQGYELKAGLIEENEVPMTRFSNLAREAKHEIADMFRIKFIESKKKLLLMQRSTIMSFMENSAGHHDNIGTLCSFFEKSVAGIAPT